MSRGVTRLDGAWGKKQVWRLHFRTWGFLEANVLYWRKYLCRCWDFSASLAVIRRLGNAPPFPPCLWAMRLLPWNIKTGHRWCDRMYLQSIFIKPRLRRAVKVVFPRAMHAHGTPYTNRARANFCGACNPAVFVFWPNANHRGWAYAAGIS